jgi:hypothetical protein
LAPMPSYPSLLRIFDYARDVRRALLASLDAAVILVEDEARQIKASIVTRSVERDINFVDAHAGRVSRETSKVLNRLTSWDLRERFRNARRKGQRGRGDEEKVVESKRMVWKCRRYSNKTAVKHYFIHSNIHNNPVPSAIQNPTQ